MAQSLAKIIVHIIFSTKDHYPFLNDSNTRKEMHAYLAKVFKQYTSPSIIVGGTNNHVHILCFLSRTETVSKVIGESKRSSSKWVKTKGGILTKFQWQNGYGVFSVGQSGVLDVKKYIANQEEHHKNIPFKEEYLNFLRKYEIEYDERYIWD